jgi:hypothetical protein
LMEQGTRHYIEQAKMVCFESYWVNTSYFSLFLEVRNSLLLHIKSFSISQKLFITTSVIPFFFLLGKDL